MEGRPDERVQVGHLLRPKIEDLARPWGDVAHHAEVVNKGVEVSVLCCTLRLQFMCLLRDHTKGHVVFQSPAQHPPQLHLV